MLFRSNTDGSYKINNIRSGTYKAFGLKDVNSNYIFDSEEEHVGFSDSLITISKNTKQNFVLFKEEPLKQKLRKAIFAEHGHIIFSFTKPAKTYSKLHFLSQEPKEKVLAEHSINNDTLHYWFTEDLKEFMKIEISEEGKILDTVLLRPITTEQAKTSSRGNKWMLVSTLNVGKDKPFDFKKPIVIKFNHPIQEKNVNEINLESGGKKILFTNQADFSDDTFRNFFFHFPFNQDSSYKLFIPPGTFTDIFGLKNDTIKINFKTQEEKYYGTLKLILTMKSNPKYILHLINEKGEVFDSGTYQWQESVAGRRIYSFLYLPPGAYKIRIIYDTNGDGKWTTGNYFAKRQPEKVIYFSGAVTIRSNWDLEVDWKVE